MRQAMKTILLAGAVMLGLLPSARAYSLAGPVGNGGDAWQVQNIGYGPPSDDVAPKNLGEEYRRNVPTCYYAYDQAFLDYFGSNGVAAVDGAFTIMNNLTNVDHYSKLLSEFPLESRHINYQAQALGLYDLKSFTLGILVRQMGLADPVQYTWTLHDRFLPAGGTCPPSMEYLVVERNFDYFSTPLNQLQYSPYVNDTLYSYYVYEVCQNAPVLAQAVPFSVDRLADKYSALASLDNISYGDFYTGLTRDDVAGLRYLLQTNNINWETPAADSLLYTITTNTTPQVFPPYLTGATNWVGTNGGGYYVFNGTTNGGLGYGDLAAFLAFSQSNSPAAVQAAYPGVVIDSVATTWAVASNATYSSYYKPAPVGSPYGSPPTFVVVTNYIPYFQFLYSYTFANVFTNHIYTNSFATLQTLSVSAPVGSPYGSPAVTNKTVKLINHISGDFFVLPPFYTNVCPLDIVSPGITGVLATTNYLTGANTNFLTATNFVSTSNSVYLVTYFTNYSYVIYPVTCAQTTNSPGLYEGIENVKFVAASYDSLLGQYFQPITNNYSMVMVTNSRAVTQHFQRIVTTPDFLLDAQDLAAGSASLPVVFTFGENINFDTANVLPGLAGPGTITTPTTITYDKVGPVFYNTPSGVMGGTNYWSQAPGDEVADSTNFFYEEYFVWASFDGTTNAPVVYPDGTSIDSLENQVLIQVSPTSVPDQAVDQPYLLTFTATGGAFSQPYTWSATGLPDGLSVSSNGTLSGASTQAGTFVFTLTLTDSLSRSVQWNYSLTIHP
jgi:hypothetical protein